jgi:hypothetical protein
MPEEGSEVLENSPGQPDDGAFNSGAPLPSGLCCCEFLVEGDILTNDLLARGHCQADSIGGMCVEVNPDWLAPHACCPQAAGSRCGS